MNICTVLIGLEILFIPVLLIMWIVRKIRKKPKMKWVKWFWLSFVLITMLGVIVDPATYCDHDWRLIDSQKPDCENSGFEKYYCELCGSYRTETIQKLGHDMVEHRCVEPTDGSDGEYVKKCTRCGFEDVEIIKNKTNKKIESSSNSESEKDEIVVNENKIIGLNAIMEEIGFEDAKIKNVEQIEDWFNGPRYQFVCEGAKFTVYCNMDGTISTVSSNGIDFYKKGYETLRAEDYIIDPGIKSELIVITEEVVKSYLNFPATADFPWLDWSVGRSYTRYSVSSKVEAKNAFGVKDEVQFTAVYHVDGDERKLIRLVLNGNLVIDELENYPIPERKMLDIEEIGESGNESEIHIVDGQLGEYGKKVKIDSDDYIWYMIPSGTYKVTCNSKFCIVFVDKNEKTKNTEGHTEMKNVSTHELNYGETAEITIGEDEHIFNTIGADFTLKKQG